MIFEQFLDEHIKNYITNNLSVSVDVETNDFMTMDCSTKTRVSVTLHLEGRGISRSSFSS